MQILPRHHAAQVQEMADQQCKELATIKVAVQNLKQQIVHESAMHERMQDKVTMIMGTHDVQKQKYRKLYGQWRQLLATSKNVRFLQCSHMRYGYPLSTDLAEIVTGTHRVLQCTEQGRSCSDMSDSLCFAVCTAINSVCLRL
jgi:hypothetical protein